MKAVQEALKPDRLNSKTVVNETFKMSGQRFADLMMHGNGNLKHEIPSADVFPAFLTIDGKNSHQEATIRLSPATKDEITAGTAHQSKLITTQEGARLLFVEDEGQPLTEKTKAALRDPDQGYGVIALPKSDLANSMPVYDDDSKPQFPSNPTTEKDYIKTPSITIYTDDSKQS